MRGPLTAKEKAGLARVIQRRAAADEAYFKWLRGDHSMPRTEWRKLRLRSQRAQRAEELYIAKLMSTRVG